MTLLEGLNTAQKKAVVTTSGPVLVLAGAGAGKTRVITHRVAYLIEQGVRPERILAVTFTNKAAKEMRERIFSLISRGPYGSSSPFVSTFHAFSAELLRAHAGSAGLPRHFSIFDRSDSLRAVKQALRALGEEKRMEPRTILSTISRAKADATTYSEYRGNAGNDWYPSLVADVWERYQAALMREHAVDFDDLLLYAHQVLTKDELVRARYQALYEYIHVDEYQDTNTVQFEIVRTLSGKHGNVFCVGDLDQNVYSWRGSTIDNVLAFESRFPGTTILKLEENYRSTKTIVALANDIIRKNKRRKEKTLFTNNPDGEKASLITAYTETDEALQVAETVRGLVAEGVSPREIAILYRANFQSRTLEDAFLRADIPYRVLGTRFFDRKEVKDTLSYLRAARNVQSFSDIARIIGTPPRGIGKTTLEAIGRGEYEGLSTGMRGKVDAFYVTLDSIRRATEDMPASKAVAHTLKVSGLEGFLTGSGEEDRERLENVRELITFATKYDHLAAPEGVEKLLEDASLATDQDELDAPAREKDAVSLMTVHAAKGLEFAYVFITGLEDGLFPHSRSDERADDEEERRLFYVALTRAKHKLFLSHAQSRMLFGTRNAALPSEFLLDIDASYLDEVGEGGHAAAPTVYLD